MRIKESRFGPGSPFPARPEHKGLGLVSLSENPNPPISPHASPPCFGVSDPSWPTAHASAMLLCESRLQGTLGRAGTTFVGLAVVTSPRTPFQGGGRLGATSPAESHRYVLENYIMLYLFESGDPYICGLESTVAREGRVGYSFRARKVGSTRCCRAASQQRAESNAR